MPMRRDQPRSMTRPRLPVTCPNNVAAKADSPSTSTRLVTRILQTRSSPRVALSALNLEVVPAGQVGSVMARIANPSLCGVGLIADRALGVEETILDLELNNASLERIVHYAMAPTGASDSGWVHGVTFTSLGEDAQAVIDQVLNR